MGKAVNYFREVKLELSKVVWPKRAEVAKLTLTVIVISVVVGVYLGGLDFLFTNILTSLVVN